MRIAVLGPLAMWAADGTPLDVRGVRLRGLLARLALSAGRPVSVETLVDGLWGSEAPSANALQSLVSRLRAGLPATESSISVQSGPAGYTLTIGPDCVDALQFEELVRRGRGLIGSDPEKAWTLLTQADKLWRGDALTDLRDLPFAAIEADRLAELRLAATEHLAEAAVSCGHARELIAELEHLAAATPTPRATARAPRSEPCTPMAGKPRPWRRTSVSAKPSSTSSARIRAPAFATCMSPYCGATRSIRPRQRPS